jgi:hypothetical protein
MGGGCPCATQRRGAVPRWPTFFLTLPTSLSLTWGDMLVCGSGTNTTKFLIVGFEPTRPKNIKSLAQTQFSYNCPGMCVMLWLQSILNNSTSKCSYYTNTAISKNSPIICISETYRMMMAYQGKNILWLWEMLLKQKKCSSVIISADKSLQMTMERVFCHEKKPFLFV